MKFRSPRSRRLGAAIRCFIIRDQSGDPHPGGEPHLESWFKAGISISRGWLFC